ncbi:hypothetical protein P3342_010512 [Pyrenophora teres f. teres]|uniref:Endoribonuclease L-PSP like protein n=1 Tax=Pyrenophora teres f. teres TaxID=97479 RepID=A0A6S6WAP4_9PLEO|nr:hypothetical protein P3342_010512 [Pyrenophora teres f. teres]CAE7200782.1 Endoribonuclease L-PSP like protein [Pyrenophora teres f. teres]
MTSNKPNGFNPPDVPQPPPTYSQVCVTPILPSSKLVTLAGQTGRKLDGTIPSSINEQARVAYESINTCLAAAGATPRDIIHVRHYIVSVTGHAEVDAEDIVDRGWGELWMEYMDQSAGGHRPSDTVVGVASLAKKDVLYECEVTVLVNG